LNENGNGGSSEREDGGVGRMDQSGNGGHCDWACECGYDGVNDHVAVDGIFVVWHESESVDANDRSRGPGSSDVGWHGDETSDEGRRRQIGFGSYWDSYR
jgi:hypothetical protein